MIPTIFLPSARCQSATSARKPTHNLLLSAAFATALLPFGFTSAETESVSRPTLETELLSPTAGDQDERLNVRVESVEQMEDGETLKIYVSMPQADGGEIEEVIVLGQPDKKTKTRTPLLQKQKFEVVNNLEEGRSGIVIYLGKREDFLLKLNYTEPRPDVEPDVFNR